MKLIGTLFARDVHILTATSLLAEPGCIPLEQASLMFWISGELDLVRFRSHLSNLIRSKPLLVFVAGPFAEDAFDALLQALSVESLPAHIMTKMSVESLSDCLEDFFQSSWPTEERFEDWKQYLVVVGEQDLVAVSEAAGSYLRVSGDCVV